MYWLLLNLEKLLSKSIWEQLFRQAAPFNSNIALFADCHLASRKADEQSSSRRAAMG